MNSASTDTHTVPSAVLISPTVLILRPSCSTRRPVIVSGSNSGVGRWYRTLSCAVAPLRPAQAFATPSV